MRYLIIGAGAIGATIGAQLTLAGRDAVLVARGDHLTALREAGLRYSRPTGTRTLRIPVVGGPDELELTADDVLMLCTKSQDTASALEPWANRPLAGGGWSDELPVVCAQNGVENERVVLRRFTRTYAMSLVLPASHLAPGSVSASSQPIVGALTLGRYPSGTDETVVAIAADLTAAGFDAPVVPDVMPWKYTKLLRNLNNAIEALCGHAAQDRDRDEAQDDDLDRLSARANAEALAVYEAAGISILSEAEEAAGRTSVTWDDVPDAPRYGGSTWQSLSRATGRVEVDYLNGEIALLARLQGTEAPVNALLQQLVDRAAASGGRPGDTTAGEILKLLPPG